jgi:choline dehydrogenase-like flavoprotein
MEMNCVENHFREKLNEHYNDRKLIISRTANLTTPLNGRGSCQYRNLCSRGCPYGGYFSSNAATLPAAAATGNLTLRPFSVVHSIIYDEAQKKAKGVRVIDGETKEEIEFYAKIIFVNASALNSLLLLLNSTSSRFPNGFGNDNGLLGHYMMFHNYRGKIGGAYDGFQDQYYFGRRPAGVYMPRFRNVGNDKQQAFLRGYAFAAGGSRGSGNSGDVIGAPLKEAMAKPGQWYLWMTGMGECLPHRDNKVTLDKSKTDAWGIPQLAVDCDYRENELAMLKDILSSGAEMLEKAGFKNVYSSDTKQAPGLDIHEMGGARMGNDPKTSILNRNNQVWDARNVFVTDGACMTSSACQNPSLTYMALTARAADFAVQELNRQNI